MIVITGASRGIGRIIAERLIEKGHEVLGLARNVESLPFKVVNCDVASHEAVKVVTTQLRKAGTPIDGLINAAGIASMNLAVTTPANIAHQIVQTNLLGTIYCCQLFAPLMLRQRRGNIINFSTIAVALGLKGESIYAASKAGVESFTRVFAREMADFNVNVNCIAPGPIDTSLLKGISAAQIQRIVSQQIISRQFAPSDIADLVELILDPRSKALAGQVFHVGGV